MPAEAEDGADSGGEQLYYQVLNFAMIVSSALMIWKGLIVVTGSESPIVVVLSGSMEPAFHRGDLLFLTNFHEDPIRAGEIVVFKVEGRDIPIVHRVIKVHEKDSGDIKFLTKGDNNEVDDRGLYKEGQNWLEKKDVVGRARGFLPYVGMVTIVMNDYPKFKYAVLAIMGAFVLLKRHLMGKKSIEEFPYSYDGGDKVLASAYSEGDSDKPIEGYQQWKEALIALLRILETSESRNTQRFRDTAPYNKKPWDSEDKNNLKEMLDYVYQQMNMRENFQS
uniref:Signal peptidase complex catalytic subunit SEC11 n=1 Tax=Leptobrachium leishanense TaxID=445787 RepID=A0A8C5LM14_9ANUR